MSELNPYEAPQSKWKPAGAKASASHVTAYPSHLNIILIIQVILGLIFVATANSIVGAKNNAPLIGTLFLYFTLAYYVISVLAILLCVIILQSLRLLALQVLIIGALIACFFLLG